MKLKCSKMHFRESFVLFFWRGEGESVKDAGYTVTSKYRRWFSDSPPTCHHKLPHLPLLFGLSRRKLGLFNLFWVSCPR